jgi:hypothetical protein
VAPHGLITFRVGGLGKDRSIGLRPGTKAYRPAIPPQPVTAAELRTTKGNKSPRHHPTEGARRVGRSRRPGGRPRVEAVPSLRSTDLTTQPDWHTVPTLFFDDHHATMAPLEFQDGNPFSGSPLAPAVPLHDVQRLVERHGRDSLHGEVRRPPTPGTWPGGIP